MTIENLSKEGLLYIAIITGGFGIDAFKEGEKIWSIVFLLMTAGLIIIRMWLKSKGINGKKKTAR